MNRGFTLLETMIAMVILSGGLILLANSWGGSFMMLRKAQLNYDVALLLERKMAEIEMEYKGKGIQPIPEEDGGDFGDEYPQFTWAMTSRELEFPDMSSLLANEDGKTDQMLEQIIKQMTDFISQSAKEVKVTILYKANSERTLTYSVTSYFVDYTKDMSMAVPGGGAPPQ